MDKENSNKREKPIKLLPSFYYMENGMKVMTEEYHLHRGYCCGNGCRHCCFWPKHTKGVTTIKLGDKKI